jgi:hypothetical protein
MRKHDELRQDTSCLNRAAEQEMLFVLLGRDAAAPATIRYWCQERIARGKNQAGDYQIEEALKCAAAMETDQEIPTEKRNK